MQPLPRKMQQTLNCTDELLQICQQRYTTCRRAAAKAKSITPNVKVIKRREASHQWTDEIVMLLIHYHVLITVMISSLEATPYAHNHRWIINCTCALASAGLVGLSDLRTR